MRHPLQYCVGGSVTDLVKVMKEKGDSLSEDIISYVLREGISRIGLPAWSECTAPRCQGSECDDNV